MEPLIIYTETLNGQVSEFAGGVKIHNYTYSEQIMGDITISCQFYGDEVVKSLFTGREFVEYKGDRYYIPKQPNYEKTNDEVLWKYTFNAYHEMYVLKQTYFFDIISEDSSYISKYFSNSSHVNTYCDIFEYADRLKANLDKLNSGWSVKLISGTKSDTKMFSLDNATLFESLSKMYETFEIPFFIVHKTIYIGDTYETLPYKFSYGINNGLYHITRTTSDENPITEITAVGGSENIPYYYPNDSEEHTEPWITPMQNLMPPIYRNSKGSQLFYSSGSSMPTPDVKSRPNQYIYENSDIHPTIKDLVYNGVNIDRVQEVEYAEDFDDSKQSDGTYTYQYFLVRIPALGFNIAKSTQENIQLSFTSGNCSACTFNILRNTTINVNKEKGIGDGYNFPDTLSILTPL